MEYEQLYAAACGNGHIYSDMIHGIPVAGQGEVPKLCRNCSAPMFTNCGGCGAPIPGYRSYPGYIDMSRRASIPWFCDECSQPHLWATPEQIKNWLENRFRFDNSLDEDAQDELLGMLAVLTPGEPDGAGMDFSKFREVLKRTPEIYAEVKRYMPMLQELFN
jgi:hypothetical protein